ncbi:hypothetical protein [Monoglobus pectinilyticus]|nr:hypothetical protein [Monoglobus pectinilyticus]
MFRFKYCYMVPAHFKLIYYSMLNVKIGFYRISAESNNFNPYGAELNSDF